MPAGFQFPRGADCRPDFIPPHTELWTLLDFSAEICREGDSLAGIGLLVGSRSIGRARPARARRRNACIGMITA